MRDQYDVMAKEPMQKSDKTDSGRLATGKQAFLGATSKILTSQ